MELDNLTTCAVCGRDITNVDGDWVHRGESPECPKYEQYDAVLDATWTCIPHRGKRHRPSAPGGA